MPTQELGNEDMENHSGPIRSRRTSDSMETSIGSNYEGVQRQHGHGQWKYSSNFSTSGSARSRDQDNDGKYQDNGGVYGSLERQASYLM